MRSGKARGAKGIGTASTRNQDMLKDLGAEVAIDYTTEKIEDKAKEVDVAFVTSGRETLPASYGVLKKGGVIVSIQAPPDPEECQRNGIEGVFLVSHPDAAELAEIGKLIDAGKIKPVVTETLPLSAAAKASDQAETHHTRGKIVLEIPAPPAG